MSKSHDLAWCAGFFDGDGFVTINRVFVKSDIPNRETYENYRLQVGINHVAPEPLQKIAATLGGQVVLDKNMETYKKKKTDGYNRKSRFYWRLSDGKAAEALKQLMPYLVNKTKVAELGLDFRKTYENKEVPNKTPADVKELRNWFREEIKRINSLD